MRVATLLACVLVCAAGPSWADGVRVVAFGAPPLRLRVPVDLKEVERSATKIRFSGDEGVLIAELAPSGELIDLQALRELAAVNARRAKTRVLEQALVEINDRPAIKLVTETEATVRTLQYRCVVDSEHEGWITYALPAARFDRIRGDLEKIETTPNRFANVGRARGLTPEGQIGLPDVPVPSHWKAIGSDGQLIVLPNPEHAELVHVTMAGAQSIVNTRPDGRGEALQKMLLSEGPLDAVFVERELAALRDSFRRAELLEQRSLRLSISDAPGYKLVLTSRAAKDGHPMLQIVYLATDELGHNWELLYSLRREHVAQWRPRLEQIELPPR